MKSIDPDIRQTISELGLFEGAQARTLDYLARHLVEMRYRAGACLWLQESEAFLFAIILQGEVELLCNARGDAVVMDLVSAGQPAGFAALRAGALNDCTAVARTDTLILAISGAHLNEALRQDPQLDGQLQQIAERYRGRFRVDRPAPNDRAAHD